MIQQSQTLFGGETLALKNSPVESFPVEASKKLSTIQMVGDFSMIPTNAIEKLCLIGTTSLQKTGIPTATKSAKKGWRLTAKW